MDNSRANHSPSSASGNSSRIPQITIAVSYQNFPGAYNEDLRGKGSLEVFAEEPRYQFTGKPRSLIGKNSKSVFASSDIRNVTLKADTRKVTFLTALGASGGEGRPFVFYCANPADALLAARTLPRHVDAVSQSWQSLNKNLAMLAAPRSPWTSVTNAIIAINIVAFVVMGFFGAGWVWPDNMAPYINYVANNGGATTDGQWWRLLTNVFVHYGAIHLAFNMWALYKVGHFVERLFGRGAFGLLYLACGLSASLASIYWHLDQTWSAGASGAVFGVYGLLLGFILREKTSIPAPILKPLTQSTLAFAGYNLLFGFAVAQIDNAAHIGGLVAGIALGWLMALPLERTLRDQLKARRGFLTAIVFFGAFAAGMIFAPRFPYSFRDQQKWNELVERFAKKGGGLEEREKALEERSRVGVENDELAKFVENESIPFYTEFRRAVLATSFNPTKSTAVKASAFVKEVDDYLESRREWLVRYHERQRKAAEAPKSTR